MIKIGILSDTHGYLDKLDEVVALTKDLSISMWLHAGDYGYDAEYMAEMITCPIYAVRGNNDRRRPLCPEVHLLPFEDTYIYMTHGDQLSPFQKMGELRFIARHYAAKLIVLGHSHCHESYRIDQALVVNPGSLALPRDGTKGTFAIATYEKGCFAASFFELSK